MPKLGLALGAGAARGWAHIGVLHAVEEAGLKVHAVAGTSAGALVGGVYAAGQLDAFVELVLDMDWKEVLSYFSDVSFSRSGLVDGRKVLEAIREYVGERRIEDLPLAFRAVATDIESGKAVVFSEGDLVEAIRASISLPGIFTPAHHEGRYLLDGGLVNPVPVREARDMGADFVVAVDVNHGRLTGEREDAKESRTSSAPNWRRKLDLPEGHPMARMASKLNEKLDEVDWDKLAEMRPWMKRGRSPHIFDVLGDSIRIMEEQVTERIFEADPPDLVLRPRVGQVRFMDFNRAEEIIEAGYQAARKPLQDLAASRGEAG